jgi:hypothetical protein
MEILQESRLFVETRVFFHIICLDRSKFVWVGLEPVLENISMAALSRVGQVQLLLAKAKHQPVSTTLLGFDVENPGNTIAARLGTSHTITKAQKSGEVIYLSWNVPTSGPIGVWIERQLMQLLKLDGKS